MVPSRRVTPMCARRVRRDRVHALLAGALLASALLAASGSATAQEQGQLPAAFTSDRPGFANTTQTAAVAHLTTEMGLTAVLIDPRVGALPNARLRVGALEWLEARLILPSAVGYFGAGGPIFGLSDMVVGFKAGSALADTVDIATVWDFSMPTATDGADFGAPEVEVTGEVILDWAFWGPLTFTPQAIFTIVADEDPMTGETVRSFVGSFSVRFTWQIIDELGVFVQSYATAGETVPWGVHAGGGVFWQALANWQLDAFFDTRVTDEGDPPTLRAGTTILW